MKKELYQALVDLYTDYTHLVGVNGISKKAFKVIKKYEKYSWKDHDGTDVCPIDENKYIKVKLRDGEVLFNQAKYFQWLHVDSDRDLIKYKVVKKGK
jgi:NAD kinase